MFIGYNLSVPRDDTDSVNSTPHASRGQKVALPLAKTTTVKLRNKRFVILLALFYKRLFFSDLIGRQLFLYTIWHSWPHILPDILHTNALIVMNFQTCCKLFKQDLTSLKNALLLGILDSWLKPLNSWSVSEQWQDLDI